LINLFVNFERKYLEEVRKIKELNSAFSNKLLNQNIQEIATVKQKLTQSRTELQRNCNEAVKLKGLIAQVFDFYF
jgi:recombination DNA repair RAD52 pathway protein